MTQGNPKPQTVATEKYRRKMGIVTKTFKIKKDVLDDFAEACKIAGCSQTGKVVEMMENFIRETKENQ